MWGANMIECDNNLWVYDIIIPSGKLAPLHYFFYAYDNHSNRTDTPWRDVMVIDDDGTVFGLENSTQNAYAGSLFTFFINVTDNIEISGAWVEYWYTDTLHINESMTRVSGDEWQHTITLIDTLLTLNYRYHALNQNKLR